MRRWLPLSLLLLACGPPEVPYYETVAPTRPTRLHAEEPIARDVEVTMYMTSWCPYCRKARRWLNDNGVRFAELDIENDPEAAAQMEALNPLGSVPTFDVDGTIVRGFRPWQLREAIRRANGR
jgi:mycoredoxin